MARDDAHTLLNPHDEELEEIRRHIERFDAIEHVTPEMRELIKRKWPHLVSKLPPEK